MKGRRGMENHVKDDYIFKLTDDTGMLQHSSFGVPDPAYGYTADDNARALAMAVVLYERYGGKQYAELLYRYSSFLLNARNERGTFRNFLGYDRKWLEEEGSEDCFGRCILALGLALSNRYTPGDAKGALELLLKRALPNVTRLKYPRAEAYSVIGLSALESRYSKRLVSDLAASIVKRYEKYGDGEWRWFENSVTYCNGVLPASLFAAYRATGKEDFKNIGRESLEFLESLTFRNGYFKPVGCKGWMRKGGSPAEFDEQPVEACDAVLAYMEAYYATGDEKYLQKARKCHAWYDGANSAGIPLVNSENGGCYDGITKEGLNRNMGAESTVSYVISYLMVSGKGSGIPDLEKSKGIDKKIIKNGGFIDE